MSCDPNFASVGLLLTFDGSNGSTVFTDTSQNALPLTVVGPAVVTTSLPMFGSGCLDLGTGFGAAGVTASVVGSGPIDITLGDFTVEFWQRWDIVPGGSKELTGTTTFTGGLNGWSIVYVTGTNTATLQLTIGLVSYSVASITFVPNAGQWYYISGVRSGGFIDIWIDGVASPGPIAVPSGGVIDSGSGHVVVGADGSYLNKSEGAVDEYRLTKGIALYTPGVNYTPPAAPFGASCATPACDPNFANVSLLLDMEGGFADTGPLGISLTNVGSVVVSPDNPKFGNDSAFFDGTNYLSAPVVAGGPFDLSTGNWTIEGFIRASATGYFLRINDPTFGANGLYCQYSGGSGGNVSITLDGNSASTSASSGSGAGAPGAWRHFAFVMNGGVLNAYLEGITASPGTQPTSIPWNGDLIRIGNIGSGSETVGNIDEFRITKGVARYTANFSPPILPFGGSCVTATVPNVIGETFTQAETDILSAGCTVGTVTTAGSGTVPAGSIISQSPIGGTIVSGGAAVDLVESLGLLVTVPDLTNTSVAVVAPALLAAADLILGTISYEASGVIIAGNIIRQSPVAGTTVSAGSAVNVVISTGLPALTVPDLFGLTQTDAINLLLSLGLVPGAIGSAPSQFVPPGEVQAQNPSAGAPVAVGTIVSFVLSQGTPVVGTLFDFEATVISQYANSPIILQLCSNLNQYIDQSANFANFYNFVWNVDTAVGFGLDIWGKIVGVGRLLQIPNTTKYVGFDIASESQPAQDWTPAGSDQPPYNNPPVGGAFYTGHNATDTYLLPDDAYRQLILAKAFANICTTTAPAINQILQNLYGPGTAFVLNTGPMAISYNLTFTPTAIQLAILEQSGVIPTPPGVSVTINTNV